MKLLSNENIKEILNLHYNIGSIEEVKRIEEGASSECFYIKTLIKEYILKDIEMIFMNHPEHEGGINEILDKYDIPVSKFIKNKNGEYLSEYKEHKLHLQTFIKGNVLKQNTAPKWFLTESANYLAKIHKALEEKEDLDFGICERFFEMVTIDLARSSYKKSLAYAKLDDDIQSIEDLEYRLKLLDKVQKFRPDMSKFTYKNTHGDYFISQIICDEERINAIIDFTSACVHPVSWEIIRSYSYADSKCINGEIDIENLKQYIKDYLEYNKLSKYDITMMGQLYFYQLAVCDYFSQYYESENTNKEALLNYAHWSTLLCRWFEKNIEKLTKELALEFNDY